VHRSRPHPCAVAPVAEAAPAAAPVTETEDQRIARLVAEGIKAALPKAIQEHVEQNGPPARKGVVPQVAENTGATASSGLPEGAPPSPSTSTPRRSGASTSPPRVTGAILQGRG
jgi:hypothetical protein